MAVKLPNRVADAGGSAGGDGEADEDAVDDGAVDDDAVDEHAMDELVTGDEEPGVRA